MQNAEASGMLDRALERLPDSETVIQRQKVGIGLTRPEIAVLLAHGRKSSARAAAPLGRRHHRDRTGCRAGRRLDGSVALRARNPSRPGLAGDADGRGTWESHWTQLAEATLR
jgi:hypothetical protein